MKRPGRFAARGPSLPRNRLICVLASVLVTTGAQNPKQVEDTQFNYKRGFYSSSFTVVIQSKTTGARIRYTLDGSAPTPTRGLGDANPVSVSVNGTTVLRAMAYKDGMSPTNVDTQTYLFVEDVLRQPAEIPGYPTPRLRSGIGEMVTLDYEMDPEVVNAPRNWSVLRKGLQAIPSLSIVIDKDHLFRRVVLEDGQRLDQARSGVYWSESGEGSTAPVSAELIVPTRPDLGFQVDAAFESHSWQLVKRAFKLKFQKEFGAGKLESSIFHHVPFNGKTAAERLDRIVLRSGKNRSWATGWSPDRTTYVRDQWARDTQIAMSGVGAHGSFVHLYLNGLYWGLYNACERPDAWFAAIYFGGDETHWASVKHDGPFQGDPSRWDYLRGRLKDKDLSTDENYAELKEYLDLTRFADYLILCWYMGLRDWPGNNWYGSYGVTPPSPMIFFVWDAEESWTSNQAPAAWVHPSFRHSASSSDPSMIGIWHSLRRNREFMMLFADRVFRHCFNGGALSEDAVIDRWAVLTDFIEDAVVAESARWGDARGELAERTRTRENAFYPEVERVKWNMLGNVDQFIEVLRAEGYYPPLDPPSLRRTSRWFLSDGLEISDPNEGGIVFYTLNGQDPRTEGGDVADEALAVDGDTAILDGNGAGTLIKARVKRGDDWSALTQSR